MSYIALYRKWRPLVFEDVVEQESVVKTLRNSVNTSRIAHAYLFCGTRGTGKTTMAKIFARAINCLNPRNGDPCNECEICKGILTDSVLDVVEIDAASNNSVDNVREIRDEVIYAPSQTKYKVYIIDEVHMLSTGAFNALLKTLEEPPEHVVFILATTDPHKLPATILSRCQRFDFRRISIESIIARITDISRSNEVDIQKDAARLIARMSDGALRDAISILDQCISLGNKEITYHDVLSVVGIVNDEFIAGMVDALHDKDMNKVLELVDTLVMEGKDLMKFVSDVVLYYRDLLICKITERPNDIIEASGEVIEKMQAQSKGFKQEEITCIIKELSALESGMKWSSHARTLLEVALIKICEARNIQVSGDIMDRLAALEERINSGNITVKQQEGIKTVSEPSKGAEYKVVKGPETPPAKISSAHIEKGRYLDGWENILNEFKNGGRMVIYTNLLGTKAVELGENFIGIIFGNGSSFNKMLISKVENLEIVQGMLSSKLGREVRVKCLKEDEFAEGQPESKTEVKEEKDELVEKAQDIAKRLNVPVNIIDE